jgi:hypothetical protein
MISYANSRLQPPEFLTIAADKLLSLSDLRIKVNMQRGRYVLISEIWNLPWGRRESVKCAASVVSARRIASFKFLTAQGSSNIRYGLQKDMGILYRRFVLPPKLYSNSYSRHPFLREEVFNVQISSRDDEKDSGIAYITCKGLEKERSLDREKQEPISLLIGNQANTVLRRRVPPRLVAHKIKKDRPRQRLMQQRTLGCYFHATRGNKAFSNLDNEFAPTFSDEYSWCNANDAFDRSFFCEASLDSNQLSIQDYFHRACRTCGKFNCEEVIPEIPNYVETHWLTYYPVAPLTLRQTG